MQPDARHRPQIDPARQGKISTQPRLDFVNAVQDRDGLKKLNNSASDGVIGLLSLPFTASDDSMVKIDSEAVLNAVLKERFFVLVERYLPEPWVEPLGAVAKPAQ